MKPNVRTGAIAFAAGCWLMLAASASAHVTIAPSEANAGGSGKYTMRVPHERDTGATIRIEVDFPPEVTEAYFEVKPGWKVEHRMDSSGRMTGAVWSGTPIGPREFMEFSFLIRNPTSATTLVWKVRQVYEDGTDSEWNPEIRIRAADR